jgi:hypothetical protein
MKIESLGHRLKLIFKPGEYFYSIMTPYGYSPLLPQHQELEAYTEELRNRFEVRPDKGTIYVSFPENRARLFYWVEENVYQREIKLKQLHEDTLKGALGR